MRGGEDALLTDARKNLMGGSRVESNGNRVKRLDRRRAGRPGGPEEAGRRVVVMAAGGAAELVKEGGGVGEEATEGIMTNEHRTVPRIHMRAVLGGNLRLHSGTQAGTGVRAG